MKTKYQFSSYELILAICLFGYAGFNRGSSNLRKHLEICIIAHQSAPVASSWNILYTDSMFINLKLNSLLIPVGHTQLFLLEEIQVNEPLKIVISLCSLAILPHHKP